MNGHDFLTPAAAEVEEQLQSNIPQPIAKIPTISSWLAKSLLLKAVRRGRADLALAAARILLQASPRQFWHKLAAVAVGEVGIANLGAVRQTFAGQANYGRLVERFGPWKPVEYIVIRLVSAAKCRAVVDLETVINGPAWSQDRTELSQAALPELLEIIASDAKIERSAIALKLAIGTPKTSVGRSKRVDAVLDCMREAGSSPELTEIARQACRKSEQTNAAYLCLHHRWFDGSECELRDDAFPPETEIQGLPSWTLDRHSREGKAAFGRLLETDCPTTRWLLSHVARMHRMDTLGSALFKIEGGLMKDRLIWPIGTELRRQADLLGMPIPQIDAAALLTLLRDDITVLNDVREQTYGR